ncbi:transglutaminase [Bacillus sp. FJAT-18019]|nr:transglutaminase [Bacillus sp. FJAT-18019]
MTGFSGSPINPSVNRSTARSGIRSLPSMLFSSLPYGTLLHRILITLPLAGLLFEWLLPLYAADGANSQHVLQALSIFAVFLLLQGLFTLRGWVWLPLNTILVVWLCSQMFEYSNPYNWFVHFVTEILPEDASEFGNAWEFMALSQETRTMILLTGWGILVSAIHMLALYRRTVWLFGGATLVYLAVLESVMEKSIYMDMMRTVLYILLAQGIMLILRLKQEIVESNGKGMEGPETVQARRLSGLPLLRWSVVVLLASLMVAGVTRLGGYFSEPSSGMGLTVAEMAERVSGWDDRFHRNTEPSVPASKAVGYVSQGEDMGAPLKLSDALFFTAQSPKLVYWRGETYERYDGRKWGRESSTSMPARLLEDLSGILPYWTRPAGDKLVQSLVFEQPTPVRSLLSGGVITQVKEIRSSKDSGVPQIAVDRLSETVSLEGDAVISGYTIETLYDQPEAQSLRNITGQDPKYIKEMYLQLPEQLPDRVRNLASEITSGTTDRYEMAKAIESYLEQNYAYSLHTAVPPKRKDFTDHFLFDAKKGYCVHFATTMVVLLRSEGIPARYVTGFAPGELVASTVDRYEVAEKNAHAWVEVFFPGRGWVMFDPTPGFGIGVMSSPPAAGGSDSGWLTSWQNVGDSLIYTVVKMMILLSAIGPVMLGIFILLVLPVIVLVIYRIPVLLEGIIYLRMSRTIAVSRREGLISASAGVWDKLQRKFGAMEKGQTMRQYVSSLSIEDAEFKADVEQFAQRWERAAYDEQMWSRTEKVHFLRQCIRIVKKMA